jgi:MYXO-CTERM domain-containing protein
MFGDRTEDTTAPAIVSMTPEDGATFWVGDNVEIAATLRGDTEDELVAVGFELWCVTGGCGGFGDGELIYTACTNPETCNAEFPLYQPVSEPWDFITLSAAPAGVWQVKLMASDYHGNAVERVVTFVIEEGGDDTGTGDGENDSGDGGSSSSGGSSGGGSSGGSSGGEGDDGEAGTDDAPPGDTRGCACAGGRTGGSPGLLLALLALAGPGVKRRRRVA